jgi:hypothetical protein
MEKYLVPRSVGVRDTFLSFFFIIVKLRKVIARISLVRHCNVSRRFERRDVPADKSCELA